MYVFRGACFGLICTLAACGSGSSDKQMVLSTPENLGEDTFFETLSASREQQVRLSNLSNTSNQNFPTSGTADFSGLAWIIVSPDADTPALIEEIDLVGDVNMVANFRTGRVTGEIDVTNGLLTTYTLSPTPREPYNYENESEVISASGSISLGSRESEIGDFDEPGVETRAYWAADYLGRVDTSEGVLRFNGEIDGQFRGNRVNNPTTDLPMKGLVGRTKTDSSSIDGAATFSTNILIGADNIP